MTEIDLSALEADLDGLRPKRVPDNNRCRLLALVEEHPEAESVLRRAVFATQYGAAATARVLQKSGLDIGQTSILKHRANKCEQCKALTTKNGD